MFLANVFDLYKKKCIVKLKTTVRVVVAPVLTDTGPPGSLSVLAGLI